MTPEIHPNVVHEIGLCPSKSVLFAIKCAREHTNGNLLTYTSVGEIISQTAAKA